MFQSNERGAIAVLVAILTPGLLFLFLLVIDVGNWYVHDRHLQIQVDAAALAGGARFGDCFSPDPSVASAAESTIENTALAYAGDKNSTTGYNLQVGGGSARITTLFNSPTFLVGSYNDTSVETQPPCQTPDLMLDVKQTETNVPFILANLISAFVPSASTVIPGINARARVELKKSQIFDGSLPLAVPDIDPKHVTVTYVNEATGGTLLAGPFDLTKGTATNGLNYWSGPTTVNVPPDVTVGVRIGLGGQSGPCAATNGTGGAGYVCYDYSDATTGLVRIDGVGPGGSLDSPKPLAWATTTCAPSGGPFFASQNILSPATSCSASVQAVLQTSTGAVTNPANVKSFTATLNGAGLNKVSAPLTYNAANGYWSTGYAFAVPGDGGPVDVSLTYQSTTNGVKAVSYSNIQRIFSGSDNDSGPVKELSLAPTNSTGSPYAVSAGTQNITVTVGVEGSLNLLDQTATTMLRLTGGSRTSAVACDGSGANVFRSDIINGCTTPYQLNDADLCPDPSPPLGPADCVPTETGEMAGPTLQALDSRFSACSPVQWPDFNVATDPRVVKLMITDFSALGGNGTTMVPVTNFAAFYVTGWTNSKCTDNDPPPANVDIKKGAIWGHFVKYIAPDPNSGGTETCDPQSITPCVPVLVK